MNYRVELESRARSELEKFDRSVLGQIAVVLDALEVNPRPPGSKKLVGQEGYRVRKSDYRVLYTIDDSARLVRLYRIAHRSDVYRR